MAAVGLSASCFRITPVKSNIFFSRSLSTVKSENKANFSVPLRYLTSRYSGVVTSVIDGVFVVKGLARMRSGAMIRFHDGVSFGLALTLHKNNRVSGVILKGNVRMGDLVFGEKSLLRLNCHFNMLGHVFDPLGENLDGGYEIKPDSKKYVRSMLIDSKAPGVITRASIHEPLYTGLKIVDSMVPIGRGQRELIIGDRQTGKTSIALDTIISQKYSDVVCVYGAMGQKKSGAAVMQNQLISLGAMSYTVLISASASDHASLQYLAPYSACAIGEYFRNAGLHSVVIYDDLSKQAVSYRQMSLLLRRPPGREAFPGDIFYVHSRLLERGSKLSKKYMGGSLTALPVIETLSGDVSAYIPTNVISITDGQIFLSSKLFLKNVRPAVDLGLSVSRVGSAAQPKLMSKIGSVIKSNLAVYREVEIFSSFSSDIDETTLEYLNYGAALVEYLKQGRFRPLPAIYQVSLLWIGVFAKILKVIHINYIQLFTNFVVSGLTCGVWLENSKLTMLDVTELKVGRLVILDHLSQMVYRDFIYFIVNLRVKKEYSLYA